MTQFINKIITSYQLTIGILLTSLLVATFYFWSKGYFDGNRQSEFYNLSFKTEALSRENELNEVRRKISEERYREALSLLKSWKVEVQAVGESIGSKKTNEIIASQTILQKDVEKLLANSKVSGVLEVFHSKLEKFHVLAVTNNWKSLSSISERILGQSELNLDASKLQRYVANVNRDLEIMNRVSSASMLGQDKKNLINNHINSMRVEIDMLVKYGAQRKDVMNRISELEVLFLDWHKNISPSILAQKRHMENFGSFYLKGTFVVIFFLFFILSFNHYWGRKQLRNVKFKFEDEMQDYVHKHVLNVANDGLEKYSEDFQNFTHKIAKNINKQHNFTLILKESIPFASVLLGDDLSVQWVNQKFCDMLGMSKDDFIQAKRNWSELESVLNFSNSGLIESCLESKASGIHSITLRSAIVNKIVYCELHVSNVMIQNKAKIMLYFVPHHETTDLIESHVNNIKAQMTKLIGILIDGHLLNETDDMMLQEEFDKLGIKSIYQLLIDLNIKNVEKQNDLLENIEKLNLRIENLLNFYESAQKYQMGITSYGRSEQETLKYLKDHLVSLTKNAKSFELISKNQTTLSEKILLSLKHSIHDQKNIITAFNDILIALPRFELLKENINALRNETQHSKAKMANTLAQFAQFKKRSDLVDSAEKFQQVFDKSLQDYMQFDRLSSELDKKVMQLEQANSKIIHAIEMLDEKVRTYDTASMQERYHQLTDEEGMLVSLSQEIEGQLVKDEEMLISDLKDLVLASRGIRELSTELMKASELVGKMTENSPIELQDTGYSDTQL